MFHVKSMASSVHALPFAFFFLPFLLFFYWIFYLFTFQMLSPFPVSHLQIPYLSPLPHFYEGAPLPTHPLQPHHPSTPLHWGIKPSQDQGLPIPLMSDKVPSAPSVLPLTPPLGSLCSVQRLAASMYICTHQALAEPRGRQLYQAPVSKHLLASTFAICKFTWNTQDSENYSQQ